MKCFYMLLSCLVTISAMHLSRNRRKEVCKIDLVILVDQSGSIGNEGPQAWRNVMSFIKDIVSSYTIGEDHTRIALVTFSNHVKMEFNFDEPDMLGKIDAMGNPNGYTATASALEKALTILQDGKRSDSTAVVLMVTDGLPTKNKAGNTIEDGATDPRTVQLRQQYIREVIDEGNLIRRSTGAKILVLGVTEHVNAGFLLKDLADPHSYFTSDNFEDLKSNVQGITEDSCKDIPSGSCTLDVAIAVDMSGSVGDDEGTLKTFLKDLSSQLEEMDPRIHTALIRFANKARIIKPLDAYGANAMQDAIDSMSGAGGYTATADAFVKAAEVFNGKDGDRPGKGNVLVLLSDGLPTKALNKMTIEPDSTQRDKDFVYDEAKKKAEELKKNHNVEIFSVVVEGKTSSNLELLEEFSSKADVVKVEEFSDLMAHILSIKKAICKNEGNKREEKERDDQVLLELLREVLHSYDA